MATPSRMKRRPGAAPAASAAADRDVVTPPAERNLNDAGTQDAILHPESHVVSIAGNEFTLHPLSSKRRRAFQVFCLDVIANASARSRLSITAETPPEVVSRLIQGQISIALGADEQLGRAACEFIARSERPPSEIPDEGTVKARADAIDESCNDFREIARAFAEMFALNEMSDLFPKRPAAPAKPPTKKAG